jgi:hypothetical protein
MALYPDQLPAARPGDELRVSDRRYRILGIAERGAYQTYRLAEIL